MTVSTVHVRVEYPGNGSTTAFPITFQFGTQADLLVTLIGADGSEAGQYVTTNFTVAKSANGTGTLTMLVAPPDGSTLRIVRSTAKVQPDSLRNQGQFYPETVESMVDRNTRQIQEVEEVTERSLRLPFGSSADGELATPVAGGVPMVNDAEDGFSWALWGTNPEALASLAMGAGSALVGFLQSGTGAEERTSEDKLREIEYNLLDVIPAAHHAAILAGTSTYDATADLQQALTNAKTVKLPEGLVNVTSNWITLRSGQRIVGAGRGKTILRGTFLFGSRGMLYADSGSAAEADNLKDIYIADLTLDGHVATLGYSSFVHLMGLYGVTDTVIERVEFKGFRGDGCYLGGEGVAAEAGEERHNYNVTFRDCVFDGDVKDNRNGLSVIDVDGLLLDNCKFRKIGNASLSASVGAIDFEPNNSFSVYRNVTIRNCNFTEIDSVNTAAITYFNGRQTGLNIQNWLVEDCTFDRCYRGISTSAASKVPSGYRDGLRVVKCKFLNTTAEDINGGGLNGVKVVDCEFQVSPAGSASYRGGVMIGATISGSCVNGIDWTIHGNTFTGQRPQFGCVGVRGVRGLKFTNNHFEDITGACFQIVTSATAGANRYLEGIIAEGNTARCLFDAHTDGSASATTGLFVNTSGIGSEFISSTCVERDNVAFGRISKHRATALAIFREQEMTAAPTTGTWERGNRVMASNASASGVPGWVCTTAGTFGTLTGVTADVTNGSRVVTNVADPSALLREGQYVTLGDSVTAFRIEKIDGATLYLNNTFNGTTATGAVTAFSAPVFKAMASLAT